MTASELSEEEIGPRPKKGSITSIEQAKRYSRQAGFAAFLIGGSMTLLHLLAANISSQDPRSSYFADPWILIDIALIFLCGVGLLRCSRVAAIIMLIEYTLGMVDKALTLENINPISAIPAIAFVLLLGRGAKGAFAYHRIRKEMDPDYKVKGKWLLWLFGMPVVGIALLIGTWCLLVELAVLPSTKILSGEEMATRHVELLESEGMIDKDETLLWFYSNGLFSILQDGNLITDKRIISYATEEEGFFASQAEFEMVDCVNVLEEDEYGDVTFEVWCQDSETFVLWFPSDDKHYAPLTNYLGKRVKVNFQME
jgi:hypothetical protein